MRTVVFQDVLNYVATLCFGTSDDLQTQHANSLIRYINKEIRIAWEEFAWPELVTVEQRWFRPFWLNSPGNYAQGAIVYDPTTNAYWLAAGACTSADVPGVSVNWICAEPFDRYVGYAQPGFLPLGEVISLWSRNPRVYRHTRPIGYSLSDNGVQVAAWSGCTPQTSVWVEHRLPPSQFTGAVWQAGTYAQGKTVYYPTDGNCYMATSSTSAAPGTDGTWAVIPFPYVLAPYVQQAVYAEWLKEDGQNDKSTGARSEAESLLERALTQLILQGQEGAYGVRMPNQARPFACFPH